MDRRLNVAFVWHMHQPLYKDPMSGEYTMPWVLLHATKDYYDMAAILEEFPQVHQTFNLVPCLIEQINEYASGGAKDRYRRISATPAAELAVEDKLFMLRFFFQANWENMIKPLGRYWDLLRKRGVSDEKEEARHLLRYFTEQDYLDLQVLFNLAWIDPSIRLSDPFLAGLCAKGGGYSEEDKAALLAKQTSIAGSIIPKYAELMARGIIEVSTTPYYHPILPLLCDSDSARVAMPGAAMPKKRFQHPEDALEQIRRGSQLYKDTFGDAPRGMWPSEGSVSMEMLPLAASQGYQWLATDEEILSNTVKRPIRRDGGGNCLDPFLYRPYEIEAGGRKVSIVFRDHVLSDLIGFDYSKMDPGSAAGDLVGRLERIAGMVDNPQDHLVSIILDGENAWEHFRNDGRDFLEALYSRLSGHHGLKCVTVSEFLDSSASREPLEWLWPGSWISHNFRIWIGHAEDNTAWDYIAEAREALVQYEGSLKGTAGHDAKKEAIKAAWDEIYASEGSDWFWWYGEDHSSMSDDDFDALFRKHIKRVYQLIGKEPPEHLDVPISSDLLAHRPPVEPMAFISPVIDGEVSNYFEWLSAGRVERAYFGSAMHKELQGGLIESVSYGFSKEALYLRLDYLEGLGRFEGLWDFTVTFVQPHPVRLQGSVEGKSVRATLSARDGAADTWEEMGQAEAASAAVVELAIPLAALKAARGDELRLFITINANEKGVERWPVKGYFAFNAPPDDFEQQDWIV